MIFVSNSLKIEKEIIVLFDDVDIAQLYIPALTTVWQARFELGTTVAQMLVDGISQGDLNPDAPVMTLPVKLKVRKSTAAPKPVASKTTAATTAA